ncbi:DUF2783 domain-containing protein [Altererythrobacter sp. Root672]|uniref:DUF2783 domain-containing protein n=1 Tax=Altererythrobacter sp. Root672 TaxID=1736584 RepID=UPI0006FBA792|nr:DUF2783 domain-containing protein [Altererythrobacter sp. Root672]KRA84213.1 hypothetical protein ASD76_09570 [Altererythrobacter sp. Root672]
MSRLIVEPNLDQVDDVYQWLVDAHAGRNETDSMRLNARLVLLLANHIGDPQVVREAIVSAASIREEGTSKCT